MSLDPCFHWRLYILLCLLNHSLRPGWVLLSIGRYATSSYGTSEQAAISRLPGVYEVARSCFYKNRLLLCRDYNIWWRQCKLKLIILCCIGKCLDIIANLPLAPAPEPFMAILMGPDRSCDERVWAPAHLFKRQSALQNSFTHYIYTRKNVSLYTLSTLSSTEMNMHCLHGFYVTFYWTNYRY